MTDGSQILVPYARNVTIAFAPNRTEAANRFNALIAGSKTRGLDKFIQTDRARYYTVTDGSNPSGLPPLKQVRIDVVEPGGAVVLPDNNQEYLPTLDTGSYYQIKYDESIMIQRLAS